MPPGQPDAATPPTIEAYEGPWEVAAKWPLASRARYPSALDALSRAFNILEGYAEVVMTSPSGVDYVIRRLEG